MRILLILALMISAYSSYAQDTKNNTQNVERSPENDGSTDRAPVDEGGGPGNGGDKRPNALQALADQATFERPYKVQIEKLKSLKLRDGKSIETKDILEVSLNEEKRLETVELKDNQIIHRLDVDTAVVKPNTVLPHVVAVNPEKLQFTVKEKPHFTIPATVLERLYGVQTDDTSTPNGRVNFEGIDLIGGALGAGSMMRVMGVDGGGRTWKDDTQSSTETTPFRVRIGVDGGGITN